VRQIVDAGSRVQAAHQQVDDQMFCSSRFLWTRCGTGGVGIGGG